MTSETVLQSVVYLISAHVGTFLLFAIAPISASLILEGAVAVFRGKGLTSLVIASAMSAGIVVVGLLLRSFGLGELHGSPNFEANQVGLEANASFYLTFAIPLAIFAFAVRMARLVFSRR